ncbi:zinc finger BED domain-containing protein RICESLEEPER 2-like [Castanea sativa]|uniref:zinc finger BED domain-containing protein RICESLEEPER 2-like n=1 Tax=Castanea sativa TaxID=21020 RepID=UPI003F64C480
MEGGTSSAHNDKPNDKPESSTTVCEGLKDQNESIVKIRNDVRYVRPSPSRLQAFKNCVEREKIPSKSLECLDLPTRWNSTYMMLEATMKFQNAFERLREEDSQFDSYFNDDDNDENEVADDNGRGKGRGRKNIEPPNVLDWGKARIFVQFLKLFYIVTLRFSGSLYVTSNAFFHELVSVQSKLLTLSRSEDNMLKHMVASMGRKYDKYWENVKNINFLLYIAVVLDPHHKLRYILFSFKQVYENSKAN